MTAQKGEQCARIDERERTLGLYGQQKWQERQGRRSPYEYASAMRRSSGRAIPGARGSSDVYKGGLVDTCVRRPERPRGQLGGLLRQFLNDVKKLYRPASKRERSRVDERTFTGACGVGGWGDGMKNIPMASLGRPHVGGWVAKGLTPLLHRSLSRWLGPFPCACATPCQKFQRVGEGPLIDKWHHLRAGKKRLHCTHAPL